MRRALATGLAVLAIAGAVGAGTATATPITSVHVYDNGTYAAWSINMYPSFGTSGSFTASISRWDGRLAVWRTVASWGRHSFPANWDYLYSRLGFYTGALKSGRYWFTIRVTGININGHPSTHKVSVPFWHTHRDYRASASAPD